jgi:hypothetical protein
MDPTDYVGKKGWSASGTLTAGEGGDGTGVTLQANFEDEPGDYTLQFGLIQPVVESGEFIKAVAEIVWTVEGNEVRRLVNCVNGMTVQGTGQAVKVRIFDDSTSTAIEYVVTALLVKGTRATVQQPPFLDGDYETFLAAEPANVREIPQNAGVISVMITVLPVNNNDVISAQKFRVHHQSAAATQLKSYDPMAYNFVPLAAGATRLLLQNLTGFDVVYMITYGIDG